MMKPTIEFSVQDWASSVSDKVLSEHAAHPEKSLHLMVTNALCEAFAQGLDRGNRAEIRARESVTLLTEAIVDIRRKDKARILQAEAAIDAIGYTELQAKDLTMSGAAAAIVMRDDMIAFLEARTKYKKTYCEQQEELK